MGLAVVNVGDVSGTLEFSLVDADGSEIQVATLEDLAPKSKTTILVRDLFPNIPAGTTPAWIWAEAGGSSWSGFALWGDDNRRHMSGIKASLTP